MIMDLKPRHFKIKVPIEEIMFIMLLISDPSKINIWTYVLLAIATIARRLHNSEN